MGAAVLELGIVKFGHVKKVIRYLELICQNQLAVQ
jgi:hypothetical protein